MFCVCGADVAVVESIEEAEIAHRSGTRCRVHNVMRGEQEIVEGIVRAEFVVLEKVADEGLLLSVDEGGRGDVRIEVRAKLAEEEVGPQVLCEADAVIVRAEQVENVSVGKLSPHEPAEVDGAMRPREGASEEGGRAWGGVIPARVVGMIDDGTARQTFKVRRGAARVAMKGEVRGGHGVREQDDEVGSLFG